MGGKGGKPAFAVLAGRDHDDVRQVNPMVRFLLCCACRVAPLPFLLFLPRLIPPIPPIHPPTHPPTQTRKQEQAAEREAAGLELPDDSLKHVTVYELDLPTLTVATDAQRWRLPASRTGCGLLPLPAAPGEEGALLVLSENWVGLKHRTAFKELRAPFPRPKGLPPAKGVLPIAWAGVGADGDDGKSGAFVALVQSEWGDVYEVTTARASSSSSSSSSPAAPALSIRALPDWLAPCTALAPLKGGRLLWAAAETGDHTLHVRRPLPSTVAAMAPGTGTGTGTGREAQSTKEAGVGDGSEEAAKVAPVFERTGPSASGAGAATLTEVAREGSLAGCLKLVAGPGQGAGRVAALCGRGAGSSLRVLEAGLPVVEELEAPLPFKPTGVWSLALGGGSAYLLLSGAQRTAVLEVGEALVEVEAEARGFVADSRTLEAGLVAQGAAAGLVQVVPSLLRYIVAAGAGAGDKGSRAGKSQPQQPPPPKVAEWRPPGRREIDKVGGLLMAVGQGMGWDGCFSFQTNSFSRAFLSFVLFPNQPPTHPTNQAALSSSCVALAVGGVEVAVFQTAALAKAAASASSGSSGGEEVKPQATRDLGVDISALHVLTLPAGTAALGSSSSSSAAAAAAAASASSPQQQQQQQLVVVGTMDLAVRVLAYDGNAQLLEERFKVTLSHRPVAFASLPALSSPAARTGTGTGMGPVLQLCVGLASGEAQWMGVEVTASSVGGGAAARASLSLRLGRSRSVGAGKALRLVSLQVGGQPAVLAVAPGSNAPAWLFYPHGKLRGPALLREHPLAYAPLEAAAPLALRALPEALVAVAASASGSGSGSGSLRLLWLEQPLDGSGLAEDAFPHALAHTPRAVAALPRSHVVVVAEGDAAASACPPTRGAAASLASASASSPSKGEEEHSHMEVDEEEEEEEEEGGEAGSGRGMLGMGKAGGLLRVLEPASGSSRQILPLEEGLMPVAVETVRFRCAPPNELFVVAAVVPIAPPSSSLLQAAGGGGGGGGDGKPAAAAAAAAAVAPPPTTGYLYTYRCLPSGLTLAHRTAIDEPEVGAPRSLRAFAEDGRLLVGFGPATHPATGAVTAAPRVRMYDLGKRRLLRKCDSGPLADDPRLARAGGGIVRLDHRGWVGWWDLLACVTEMKCISGTHQRINHHHHHHPPRARPWVFATDALKGVQALLYSAQENRLRPVADDPVPRLVSDALVIDR